MVNARTLTITSLIVSTLGITTTSPSATATEEPPTFTVTPDSTLKRGGSEGAHVALISGKG